MTVEPWDSTKPKYNTTALKFPSMQMQNSDLGGSVILRNFATKLSAATWRARYHKRQQLHCFYHPDHKMKVTVCHLRNACFERTRQPVDAKAHARSRTRARSRMRTPSIHTLMRTRPTRFR